jgi:hypothetical protein
MVQIGLTMAGLTQMHRFLFDNRRLPDGIDNLLMVHSAGGTVVSGGRGTPVAGRGHKWISKDIWLSWPSWHFRCSQQPIADSGSARPSSTGLSEVIELFLCLDR